MSKRTPRTYTTNTGRVLTDRDIEALAAEAERGYDVSGLRRRVGRPRIGSAPAIVVPVRMHRPFRGAVEGFAEDEETSVSELVRDALSAYLATALTPVQYRTSTGRVIGDQEFEALADEAERGYDIETFSVRPKRRVGERAEVVPVRMPPELKLAAERRAQAEETSLSELVRKALQLRMAAAAH